MDADQSDSLVAARRGFARRSTAALLGKHALQPVKQAEFAASRFAAGRFARGLAAGCGTRIASRDLLFNALRHQAAFHDRFRHRHFAADLPGAGDRNALLHADRVGFGLALRHAASLADRNLNRLGDAFIGANFLANRDANFHLLADRDRFADGFPAGVLLALHFGGGARGVAGIAQPFEAVAEARTFFDTLLGVVGVANLLRPHFGDFLCFPAGFHHRDGLFHGDFFGDGAGFHDRFRDRLHHSDGAGTGFRNHFCFVGGVGFGSQFIFVNRAGHRDHFPDILNGSDRDVTGAAIAAAATVAATTFPCDHGGRRGRGRRGRGCRRGVRRPERSPEEAGTNRRQHKDLDPTKAHDLLRLRVSHPVRRRRDRPHRRCLSGRFQSACITIDPQTASGKANRCW